MVVAPAIFSATWAVAAVSHLTQRLHITSIEQLTDTAGEIHSLVLQRRQAVVKHSIGHMQVVVFQFRLHKIVNVLGSNGKAR